MPLRRPRRLRAFEYRGRYRYFVTCCVHPRRPVFVDEARVWCVRAEILRTCTDRKFELIAAIYMPDHLHLLVQGASERALFTPFMTLLRQRCAIAFRRAYRATLWQDGYYERVLRREDDTVRVVEYMAGNPVRAGLVDCADAYPYLWSCVGVGRPM